MPYILIQNCYLSENWPNWPKDFMFHKDTLECTGGKCSNPQFLDNFCSRFPIQFTKTVRFPLNLTESLLDEIPDLKIVYLVRDPRANLQSRKGAVF